ncbi:hypothetical protein [Pseudocitrobacter cyperus]|uniref:Uncharacterized protein n=1 Tax=Pseudocitrobacter cyperus TaxID=3112843 RepID=A0ABV0HCP1_9ENTR
MKNNSETFFITLMLLLVSRIAMADPIEPNDDSCRQYEQYARWVKQGSGSDEQKLMRLNRYINYYYDEYASSCDSFDKDKDEYLQRVFAYVQSSFPVTPSLVLECTTITDDDICDGDRDWTSHLFLLSDERKLRRPLPFKSNEVFLPYSKMYIPDMEMFVSFARYRYSLTGVYYYFHSGSKSQHIKLLPGPQKGEFVSLDTKKINEQGTIACQRSDSCSRLTAIYKRDDYHYLKAVWYY